MMLFRLTLVVAPLILGACATVVSETRQPLVVGNATYEVRIRTMEGPNGTFQTADAMVGGVSVPCRIDSPGDCEAAARRGINRFDGRD
jgi:hypothetical protein